MNRQLLPIAMAIACCSGSCSTETGTSAADSRAGLRRATQHSKENRSPGGNTDEVLLRDLVASALEQRGHYRRPTTDEIERATRLFKSTFAGDADFDDLQTRWDGEGLELVLVNGGEESFWVLQEKDRERFGRGIVVFRRSDSVPLMLQAPHSFFDRDTDEIALRLFVQSRCRVCFWNSVHRRIADLADEEDSFLNGLTVAFEQSCPHGRTVQLHGFYDDPKRPRFDRSVNLIISQGTDTPTSRFLRFAQTVRQESTPFEAAVYPQDVRALGGTLNRQRQVLLREGNDDFVHLEMSPGFRQAVLDDRDLRGRLGRALSNLELNPLIQ
jgi:hypothetical protein